MCELAYEEKTRKRYEELEKTFHTLQAAQEKIISKTKDFTPILKEEEIKSSSLETTFDALMNQMEELSEELMQAQLRIHSIINAMPSILISVTDDLQVADWNEEAETNFGVAQALALSKPLFDACPVLKAYKVDIEKAITSAEFMTKSKIKKYGFLKR